MPSPSCQNLRSAPQKHPIPNKAVSIAGGNGGRRLCPVMKWVSAVATGSARPGSASAAAGKDMRLRNNTMTASLTGFVELSNLGLPSYAHKLKIKDRRENRGAGVQRLEKPNFGAGLPPSLIAKAPMAPQASQTGNLRRSTTMGFQITR